MRLGIEKLQALGPLPDATADDAYPDSFFVEYEDLLERIIPPITMEEARVLVTLFPPTACYGLEWSLLHLIETAPGWPAAEVIALCTSEEWKTTLSTRA